MKNTKRKFDYSYIIIALCFLMVFTAQGFSSMIKSMFIAPVSSALGISRTIYSLNDIFCYAMTALMNIYFGTLQNRFGVKKLVGAGFFCLMLSAVIYSVATNFAVYCIGSCFLGMGYAWTTTTMVGCVITRWCKNHRGTFMGLSLAANGFGGAISAQLVSPLINNGTETGYKGAYLLVALVFLIVGIICIVFFRDKPESENENVSEKDNVETASTSGVDFKEAIRLPYFYISSLCILITGMMLQGTHSVAAAHLRDSGLDAALVATVLSIFSLSLAAFKCIAGILYDRFGLSKTVSVCTLSGAGIFVCLALIENTSAGRLLASVYAVLGGIAFPLETVLIPIFTSELFGKKDYNRMLGIFDSVNVIGFALGSPVLNMFYDLLNSYSPAFLSYGAVLVLVCAGMLSALRSAKKYVK